MCAMIFVSPFNIAVSPTGREREVDVLPGRSCATRARRRVPVVRLWMVTRGRDSVNAILSGRARQRGSISGKGL